MHANRHWTDLCGYNLREIEGATDSILHGPLTNKAEIEESRLQLQLGNAFRMKNVLYYRKNGTTFCNDVALVPVRGPSITKITHYCAYMEART